MKSLPYPVWKDNNLNYYYDTYDINSDVIEVVGPSLVDSFSDIIGTDLYYPFSHEYNNKIVNDHAHSFEEVVSGLYIHPVSFFLKKEDTEFYNEGELSYLKYLQKYLLFVGREDTDIITKNLCNNSLADKLSKCSGYYNCSNEICELILQNELKKSFYVSYFNLDNSIVKKILRNTDGDILGIIKLTIVKYKKLDELDDNDLDYKLLGYNDLDSFKDYISNNYDDDIKICIEDIEVMERF